MSGWRVRWGGGFLAAVAALALAAPWIGLRDPFEQPDTAGLRELPPLARPHAVRLADGSVRFGRELRRLPDGSVELLRGARWRRLAPADLAPGPEADWHRRPMYLLGTDGFGRDVLSRLLHGARISLAVGLLAAGIALGIGLLVGAAAGLGGARLDSVLMRLTDVVLSVPRLFLALLLVSLYRASLATTVVVLGATTWMAAARLVRGEFLSLRERDFVLAARASGARPLRVGLRHLLPGAFAPLLVEGALRVGDTILLEAALSFLGLGVQPPVPSWGNMVADGRGALPEAWWVSTLPGLAIALTVVSLNLLADAAAERRGVRPERRREPRAPRKNGKGPFLRPADRPAAALSTPGPEPIFESTAAADWRASQPMTTKRTRSRVGERGEGRVGFAVTLIIVAIAVFVGIKVIPVRVSAYEFRDLLREEARYGAVRDSNETVTKRILQKAAELEIPLRKQDLTVSRTDSTMIIKASYEQPIDLKVTTYVYRFNATEKAPLF